jgi:hypothetical protein
MSMPLVTVAVILVIGAIYVLLPLALGAYLRFRKPREVICPEINAAALVRFDARYAAATAALGATDLRLVGCARWPERGDCDRRCASQVLR